MAPGVDDAQAKLVPPVPVPPPVVVPEPVPPVAVPEPVPPVAFGPPLPMSLEMTPVQAESPSTNVDKMVQALTRLPSLRNFEMSASPSVPTCLFQCVAARDLADH